MGHLNILLSAVSESVFAVVTVWSLLCGSAFRAEAQVNEERAVIEAAQAMFDAMEALDPEAFLASMVPEGFLRAIGFETTQSTTRDRFAARLANQTQPMFERMWNPEVRIDGPVATLWAPYDFYRGIEFSHCGTDAFQLAKTGGTWKVVLVSYTVQMPPDCSTHPEGPPMDARP